MNEVIFTWDWYTIIAFFVTLLTTIPLSYWWIRINVKYDSEPTFGDYLFGVSVGTLFAMFIGVTWLFSIFVLIIATIMYWYKR